MPPASCTSGALDGGGGGGGGSTLVHRSAGSGARCGAALAWRAAAKEAAQPEEAQTRASISTTRPGGGGGGAPGGDGGASGGDGGASGGEIADHPTHGPTPTRAQSCAHTSTSGCASLNPAGGVYEEAPTVAGHWLFIHSRFTADIHSSPHMEARVLPGFPSTAIVRISSHDCTSELTQSAPTIVPNVPAAPQSGSAGGAGGDRGGAGVPEQTQLSPTTGGLSSPLFVQQVYWYSIVPSHGKRASTRACPREHEHASPNKGGA